MSNMQQLQHTPFPILSTRFSVGRMGDVIFFVEKDYSPTPFAGGRIAKQDGGYRGAQTKVKEA
jgi:hypothetical protein